MSRTEELTDAVRRLSLNAARFRIIAEPLASPILNSIRGHFVEHEAKRWWWEAFREYPVTHHFSDGSGWSHLTRIAPVEICMVWFVVEDGPEFILAEGTIEAIQAVLDHGNEVKVSFSRSQRQLARDHAQPFQRRNGKPI